MHSGLQTHASGHPGSEVSNRGSSVMRQLTLHLTYWRHSSCVACWHLVSFPTQNGMERRAAPRSALFLYRFG